MSEIQIARATTPRSSFTSPLTPKSGECFQVPKPKAPRIKADISAVNGLLSLASNYSTPPVSPPGSPKSGNRQLAKVTKDLYNSTSTKKRARPSTVLKGAKKQRLENGEAVEVFAEDIPHFNEGPVKQKERAFMALTHKIVQPEVYTAELQRISTIASSVFSACKEFKKKSELIASFFQSVFRVKPQFDVIQWTELLTNSSRVAISDLVARAIIVHANEDIFTHQYRLLNWRHLYTMTSNFNLWLTTVLVQPKQYLSSYPGILSSNYVYVDILETDDHFYSMKLSTAVPENATPSIAGRLKLFSAELPLRLLPKTMPSSEEVIFKIL